MSERLRVLDLFSGIGGFSLGLENTGGFETAAFCEIEKYPRKVLAKHWPGVPIFEDVRTLEGKDVGAIDVICGGFPCQDVSHAGRLAGMRDDTRSGLWSEIVRLVRELGPEYVIVENVSNLLSGPAEQRGGWFGRVLGDLASCGYDAEWENIPASSLGAIHRRERVWLVAYTAGVRREVLQDVFRCLPKARKGWQAIALDPQGYTGAGRGWSLGGEPALFPSHDGVSGQLAGLKAVGNAVVPQIAELIGYGILADKNSRH